MLGYRLRKLRLERGMTQTQLAKRIGISKSAISGYELELRQPTYNVLRKLARFFDVTTDYLIGNFNINRVHSALTDKQIGNTIKILNDLLRLLQELDLY